MSSLPFRPHPLLRSGHLQTLAIGVIPGDQPPYRAKTIKVELEDGEAVVVHEEAGVAVGSNADLVILIHGLGGDHSSPYLGRLAGRLEAAGFLVWRVDLRGCGRSSEFCSRPANAGRSHDLAAVVNHAGNLYPGRPIHVVGFSLSGNIVLKMLGEAGGNASALDLTQSALASAIAVAPPAKLKVCADNMERWSRWVYTSYYLKVLDDQVQAQRRRWPNWARVPEEPVIKSIRQFDARYTAPLSGYRGSEEYYAAASSLPLLPQITTNTEIIADRHDPIVPYSTIAAAKLSESTKLTTTRKGGHMGYYGLDERGKLIRWLEHYVAERLKENRIACG